MLARAESNTLRVELNKSINEYLNDLPLFTRLFWQGNEKAKVGAYARHLTSVEQIDLASEVVAHLANTKPRPCEMSKDFCAVLRDALCRHFNITHNDIIRAEPTLYKSGVAASGYANTGLLAQQNYIEATHRVLKRVTENRELRPVQEVCMHKMGSYKQS